MSIPPRPWITKCMYGTQGDLICPAADEKKTQNPKTSDTRKNNTPTTTIKTQPTNLITSTPAPGTTGSKMVESFQTDNADGNRATHCTRQIVCTQK